jgi:hypothetical protein
MDFLGVGADTGTHEDAIEAVTIKIAASHHGL